MVERGLFLSKEQQIRRERRNRWSRRGGDEQKKKEDWEKWSEKGIEMETEGEGNSQREREGRFRG